MTKQTEINEYKEKWRNHLETLGRLKWNLSREQSQELDKALDKVSEFISLASHNLEAVREEDNKEQETKQELKQIKVGDTFYTSWGYDQTNYDFIIVTSISPTRKTAMCKLAKVERVRSEAQHNVKKPKTEGYGFEFRMRIEKDKEGNECALRGSYPHCASQVARGDSKEECGFRLDSFWKTEENKEYWETDTMFGH